MRRIDGVLMIYDIFKKLVVHPDFNVLNMPTESSDEVNGTYYGFGYRRKKLSSILRHEGEVEIYYVGYYDDVKEVVCVFENNGYSYEVTSAEIFNS